MYLVKIENLEQLIKTLEETNIQLEKIVAAINAPQIRYTEP